MSEGRRRVEHGLFWVAVVALLAAHMFGVAQGDRALVLGWMPADLVYRVVWIGLAAGLVFWMTGRLWPDAE